MAAPQEGRDHLRRRNQRHRPPVRGAPGAAGGGNRCDRTQADGGLAGGERGAPADLPGIGFGRHRGGGPGGAHRVHERQNRRDVRLHAPATTGRGDRDPAAGALPGDARGAPGGICDPPTQPADGDRHGAGGPAERRQRVSGRGGVERRPGKGRGHSDRVYQRHQGAKRKRNRAAGKRAALSQPGGNDQRWGLGNRRTRRLYLREPAGTRRTRP